MGGKKAQVNFFLRDLGDTMQYFEFRQKQLDPSAPTIILLKPVELQIRVGSILKKVHILKAGCSKRVKSKGIYKAYMPGRSGSNDVGLKSLLYYYDETCQPYIWIHDVGGGSLRMVKQQYVSLEDLRECCEIRILRDQHKGCISVCKRTRPDLC
ncbi:unnamed protein product [Vicia faba]|uniref:Uncharacterized protein n=1 Tax=Vicia faba TaxID=3906 RepID=A0AAV0ZC53_VICFA|nr:unnamed protein product [Vicia faba]